MTPIAHPDGRPWRYWPRRDGGMWIMVPTDDGDRPVGYVEPRSTGWRAEAWDRSDSYRSAHGPHEAARLLYEATTPTPANIPAVPHTATQPAIPAHQEAF